MSILPHQITDLVALNKERHNYNTRQTDDMQINAGEWEVLYKLFIFHGVQLYGIIYPQKLKLMSYACFKHLNKNLLTKQ